MILALPLLLVAACNVENDERNDRVTLDFDQNAVEDAADEVGNALEDAGTQIGDAAENAGQAIEDEVDSIDVDVDVSRNKADDPN
jgi:hypothetical protein